MSPHTSAHPDARALSFSRRSDLWFPRTTLIYIQPHFALIRISARFKSVPLNCFVSPCCQALPATSLHIPTRSLSFWSPSDCWLLHCTHCISVCLTRSLIGFIPSRSPSFPNAFRRVSVRPCTLSVIFINIPLLVLLLCSSHHVFLYSIL